MVTSVPSTKGTMPGHSSRYRRSHGLPLLFACLVASLLFAAGAQAADRVYWTNYSNNTLSFANLDGSGGGQVTTTGATASGPRGLAIDSAAGRVYWVNESDPKISFADLDGSGGGHLAGATTGGASGLAIDPAAARVYWADGSTIEFASLDGTGGATLNTTGATVNGAAGVAIDPVGGLIWWANVTANKISFARLDGSGGGDLPTGAATVDSPEGVALDLAGGRIWWPNQGTQERISYANLDGSGGGDLATGAATVASPIGVAVDAEAGRIYWSNWNTGGISFANINGSGGGDLAIAGATADSPNHLALLQSPVAASAPAVSGGSTPGSTLSCSTGGWAEDLLGASLYRGPSSFAFQWTLDGADIAGATDASYTAFGTGEHRCRVTAGNTAGSASQVSGAHVIAAPGEPAPPAPAPAPTAAPPAFGTLTLVTLRLRTSRIRTRRPLGVVIANANTFPVTARVSARTLARISRRRRTLRPVTMTVPASARRTASLRLPRVVQRFLARTGRLRLQLRARVTDPAGNTRFVARRVTVRRRR